MFLYRNIGSALARISFFSHICGAPSNIVFLHSLGADSAEWNSSWDFLKGRANLIAIDARGHGLSSTADSVTLDDWMADIKSVMDFCGFRRASLIGLSMGGVQALHFASHMPTFIDRLVLADTFAEIPVSSRKAKVVSLAEAINRQGMLAFGREYAKTRLIRNSNSYPYGDALIRSIGAMSPHDYLASAKACFGAALGATLHLVEAPTLVIRGALDEAAPRPLSDFLVDGIANAAYSEIPDAGHLSNLDQPHLFNTLVSNFLGLPSIMP